MAEASPEAAVVGVLNSEDRPVGVGVLLGPRHIVTCAHVVNVALGLDERSQPRPDGVIRVRLPLVDGDPLRARVARWVPPPTAGAAGDDIAGLELLDAAPAGAVPARLVVNQPPAGRSVRVFGYPGCPRDPTVRGCLQPWLAGSAVGDYNWNLEWTLRCVCNRGSAAGRCGMASSAGCSDWCQRRPPGQTSGTATRSRQIGCEPPGPRYWIRAGRARAESSQARQL